MVLATIRAKGSLARGGNLPRAERKLHLDSSTTCLLKHVARLKPRTSNRVHGDGSCGGVGWIINPDGGVLATTSAREPICTCDLDLSLPRKARQTYPRYVFAP